MSPAEKQSREFSAGPLVSVVIPAYNSGAAIGPALDSVVTQSFTDFEVIVVNDGSTETQSLEAAIRPYQNRVRYLKQENKGPGAARNTGILHAKGAYVAFLDSDDTWLPDHLGIQMAMLSQDAGLDLVYADSLLVENNRIVGHAFGREPQSFPVTFEKILAEQCTVGTSSTVVSRAALIAAGLFDERFRCCEDFDLWIRMAFAGAKMKYGTSIHVRHALAEGSLSSDTYVMKRARIEVYEKTAASLAISAGQRSLIHRLIAKTEAACQSDLLKQFLHAGDYRKALGAAQKAAAFDNTWKLRMTILGLRSVPSAVRAYQQLHEKLLAGRSVIRRACSLRRLSSARPQISSMRGHVQ